MDTEFTTEPQPFPAPGDRLWTVSPGVLRGTIGGQVPNKSNSRKVAQVGPKDARRMLFIKSDEARKYEKAFEQAVQRSPLLPALPEKARLYFKVTVYQENLRRDLDCELLPDLLQKFGVIKNDRAIWKKDYERKLDKENPRVEFEIGVISDKVEVA